MTTMTRQHFNFIADTLKGELEHVACGEAQREMVKSVAEAFALALKATNPGFKPDRFLRACGVDD